MTLGITRQPEKPAADKIAGALWHELNAHDESEYPAIGEEFSRKFPSLNVKKMINEYKYKQSVSFDLWCKCGIGKRYKHNGEFVFLAGEGIECTCTMMVQQVP